MPSSALLFPFSPLSFSFKKNHNFSKESVSCSRKSQVKSATFFFQKAKTLPETPAVQWIRRPARREGSNKLQLPCIQISMLFPKILNSYNYFNLFIYLFFDRHPRHCGIASNLCRSRRAFLRNKNTNLT